MTQLLTMTLSSPAAVTILAEQQIRRVAAEMNAQHGQDAFAKASAAINTLNSNGYYLSAGTWRLIREEILRLQEAERGLSRNLAPDASERVC